MSLIKINTCKSDIIMSTVFVNQMPDSFQTTNKLLKAAIDENTHSSSIVPIFM